MLFATAGDVSRSQVGDYGPKVGGSEFWQTGTSGQVSQRSGLLASVTRDLQSMLAIKGFTYVTRGNTQNFCLSKPYVAPISFSGRRTKIDMEDALLQVQPAFVPRSPPPLFP
jgi:hypothetical protein